MVFDKNFKVPLVSVITPCYNGELFLKRFLDSLLMQTYNNIEFVLVNDGSIDRTEEIALNYKSKFKERGFKYIYIYRNNAGQAAAINQGLRVVKGKYLIWPDSDDILEPNSIKVRVDYLEKNPDKGMVAGKSKVVNESDLNKIIAWQFNEDENNWIENLYFSGRYSTISGIYMVRVDWLFKIYPNRKIFESREDQNFQLLLPMAYYYHYGNIGDIVYTYVERRDSHSHQRRSIEELISRSNNFIVLVQEIIKLFDDKNYAKSFLNKVCDYEYKDQFIFSIQFDNVSIARKCYNEICKRDICTYKDRFKYWRYRLKMFIRNLVK